MRRAAAIQRKDAAGHFFRSAGGLAWPRVISTCPQRRRGSSHTRARRRVASPELGSGPAACDWDEAVPMPMDQFPLRAEIIRIIG